MLHLPLERWSHLHGGWEVEQGCFLVGNNTPHSLYTLLLPTRAGNGPNPFAKTSSLPKRGWMKVDRVTRWEKETTSSVGPIVVRPTSFFSSATLPWRLQVKVKVKISPQGAKSSQSPIYAATPWQNPGALWVTPPESLNRWPLSANCARSALLKAVDHTLSTKHKLQQKRQLHTYSSISSKTL